jgi:phage shock protein PspC (stress-responsive transcriptional regulator)
MTMKKVININFQGRVVPIEETAFEQLKQYIESLRRYFANEEGRDEIINDIESRIAELFSERLKKGAVCITDDDVNAVIASMGRPEDFEADEATSAEPNNGGGAKQQQQQQYANQSQSNYNYAAGRGRLYRNADDKIVGGVASGLANYFKIDPVIMRILFVVFIAFLFWVYILLWVIIPSQSIETNITKRLYRSSEDKVIAGVCGGLAAYFNVAPWIPRLIFAFPLIIGLISGPFNIWWGNDWDFWWGPKMITGSLGSTLFLTYIILWIAVPVAVTSAEKLEMRGEKVDLNSIRDTVKEDLEGFKHRAEKWGKEVKESAQQWGEKAKEFGQTAGTRAKTFSAEAAPVARSAGSGIGHVIAVLFKAFFLCIAGVIVIALFTALVAILFGGFSIFPVKDFIFDGFWQNLLAWGTLILFLGVPMVALLTWLIRRIMGVRSRNHYLGYVFGTLWFLGLVCVLILGSAIGRDFKAGAQPVEEEINLTQPYQGKMYINVANNYARYYGGDWFGIDWEDWPFYAVNQDTIMLNTIRVNVVKSKDAGYHVHRLRFSRGSNPELARGLAEKISFDIKQSDSMLVLPKGFAVSRTDKFRNQQVLVIIEVPVGKRIQIDHNVEDYEWFNINFNRRRGWDIDDNWNRSYGWQSDKEYIMTPDDGLQRTEKYDLHDLKSGKFKLKAKDGDTQIEIEGEIREKEQKEQKEKDTTNEYRYRREKKKVDSVDSTLKKTAASNTEAEGEEGSANGSSSRKLVAELSGPVSTLTRLFQ